MAWLTSTPCGPGNWTQWMSPTPVAAAGAVCSAWNWKAVAFTLKRQSNYLTRTLHRPFGEPTFAREFRNISRYRQKAIPALQAAFYGERKVAGEYRALLLTRALDGWNDLDSLLEQWPALSAAQHHAILVACGQLARKLHGVGQVHGCFYPKHIFLQATGDGYAAQLIDLEKPGRCCWAGVIGSKTLSHCCAVPAHGHLRRCGNSWRPTSTSRRTVRWWIPGRSTWRGGAVTRRPADAVV
jgi:hypothetical protein